MGRKSIKAGIYMCVCVYICVCYSHCCTAETNNPIKQLCSNKKKLKRKKHWIHRSHSLSVFQQIVPTELDWWHFKWECIYQNPQRQTQETSVTHNLKEALISSNQERWTTSNFYDHITVVKILDLIKTEKSSTCWDIVVYYILIPSSMILRQHNPLLVSL